MPLLLFFTVLLNGPHYHRIISRYLFTPDGCVYRMEELPNRGGLVSSLICLEHRLKILGKLGYPRKLIVFFFSFSFLKNTLETDAYIPFDLEILITREYNLLNFCNIGGKQFRFWNVLLKSGIILSRHDYWYFIYIYLDRYRKKGGKSLRFPIPITNFQLLISRIYHVCCNPAIITCNTIQSELIDEC